MVAGSRDSLCSLIHAHNEIGLLAFLSRGVDDDVDDEVECAF